MAVPSPPSPKQALRASPKQALRADALARRKAFATSLADETRRALEAALAALVMPRFSGATVVAGYHPMREEISPLPLLGAAAAAGATTALPWFADRDTRMIFREAPADGPGPWGVPQPPATARAVKPSVVLVPLVLCDRAGTRIGHGKGHYDRVLAHLRESGQPVYTIGLAWEWQLVDEALPRDPWDQPLDAVATPGEFVLCNR